MAKFTLAQRTVKNWKWWAIILPLSILAAPLVLLDITAALILYLSRDVAEYAHRYRVATAAWWREWTGPIRRYAYDEVRNDD